MDMVRIDRSAIPHEEHGAAEAIERNLLLLQLGAREFRQSFDLYVFAHERKLASQDTFLMIGWMKIAGRNGAVVAYDFMMVMKAINELRAPQIRQRQDHQLRKAGSALFESSFPRIAAIRNSTAHSGQMISTEASRKRHALKEPTHHGQSFFGAGSYVSDDMTAFTEKLTFATTRDGSLLSYDLSEENAEKLSAVAKYFCQSFYPLEDARFANERAYFNSVHDLG